MNEQTELRREEANRWWEQQRDFYGYAKEYGHATASSLLTINGGAIIAYLSFLAASDVRTLLAEPIVGGNVIWGLSSFGLGVLFAVVVSALGYLNFVHLADNLPGPHYLTKYVETGDTSGWSQKSWIVRGTAIVAAICALLSAALFLIGAYFSLQVLIETGK